MAFPSGSAHLVHDYLAKGLAELGHEVLYLLKEGAEAPPPPGVTLASEPAPDADVFHNLERPGRPWVQTIHIDETLLGRSRSPAAENAIFISRFLAGLYGASRFVLNGIDPVDCIYSETKDDYLFFLCNMDRHIAKGLDLALALSAQIGFDLVVAGASRDPAIIDEVTNMCRRTGATYLGDVRGTQKMELFAGAKAVLFPSRLNEGYGLVIAEALMSGTPVICSDKGACPELMSPDAGFVCGDWEAYVRAVEHIGEISPRRCREIAMRDHHYLRMAADYVREYEQETARFAGREQG